MGTDARAGLPAGAGRLVYNMYRDMLKNYNDRANEILETKPAGCVSEDRGVADLVHSMARQLSSGQQMSSETSAPSANGTLPTGPPPPPPPPPLALGAVPAVRLKSEIGERREPPPCVQNAMMTKDKKPFTYTPGGLDLSQIRSPRMARRLTRNAMSEGVQAQAPPPASAAPTLQPQEAGGPPPPPPPMMMQPQVRPQVLPMQPPPVLPVQPAKAMPVQSPPVQPPKVIPVQSPPIQPPKVVPMQSPPVVPIQSPPIQQSIREPVKLQQPPSQRQPVVSQPPPPPAVNQYKEAASPVQQREVIITQPVVREAPAVQQQRDRVPAQAATSTPMQLKQSAPTPPTPPTTVPDGHIQMVRRPVNEPRSQVGSIYVPPLSPEEVAQKSGSSTGSNTPATPAASLNKAPTPWLTSRAAQQRQEAPSWARAGPPSGTPAERVIPVQIEFTSTPSPAADERNRSQPQEQHRPHLQMQMQRQPSVPQQQQFYQQQQQQQQLQQQQQQRREHVVRVIPIQIEGRRPAGNDTGLESPAPGGPVQSPAFRVLERVTSRDEEIHSQPAVEHPPTVGHAFYREQQQQAQARRDQREPEPRKYTGASIPSRSFQMLQAMVAPENCAADGTRADDLTGGDCPGSASDAAAHPCPVPPWGQEPLAYWPDPYWAYMQALVPGDGGDSGASDNSFWYAPPPPPPWDPYMAAAYWYGYWPPCTPHPPYTSSDTDDYSSTDEMGRYGLGWPQPPYPQQQQEQQQQPTPQPTSSDTDAEPDRAGLQAIRSVSDIQVYNEANGPVQGRRTATDIERSTSASSASSSPSLSEESSDDDDDDDDEDFEVSECPTEDGVHMPHQLSVIFEESEISDAERKRRELSVATTVSEDDSSATVAVHTADTDNEENHDEWDGTCETTVTVRLPLKLKFGKTVNGANDVTEVVVGDSEVRSSGAPSPRITHLRRQRSDDTVENYETAESDTDTYATERKMVEGKRSIQTEDNELGDDEQAVSDDDAESDEGSVHDNDIDESRINNNNNNKNNIVNGEEDSVSDDYYNDSNEEVENNVNCRKEENDIVSDIEDKRNSSVNLNAMSCDEGKDENENETSKLIENLITNECRTFAEADTPHVSVRQRVMAIEGQSSLECTGDEDIDSGVTSDVSRHTDTETDCTSDMLRNRYQRAATHSRLFKLLQDECSKSDDEEDNVEGRDGCTGDVDGTVAPMVRESAHAAKKQMWLPLSGSDPESFSSSGVCSPASPTWAARELVRGMCAGLQHEDALSNTSEDGSPLDSCYSSDYRSYFNSWERAAARARCPRIRAPPTNSEVPAREAATSPAPRRQAAGAS